MADSQNSFVFTSRQIARCLALNGTPKFFVSSFFLERNQIVKHLIIHSVIFFPQFFVYRFISLHNVTRILAFLFPSVFVKF